MRSQRKAERKKILGTDIDVIRADRAINLTSRYLEQNNPGELVFLTTAEILAGQEEARLADFLTRASLVLPGDQNVEDALETSLRVGDYDSYAVEYFEGLFYRLNRRGAGIYVMASKEEDLFQMKEDFSKRYNHLHIEGTVWSREESMDQLVNQINALAPEILLVCGKIEKSEAFFSEYENKINAGLSFCIEEMETGTGKKLPAWVTTLHMKWLYQYLYEKPKHMWNESLFKHRIKEEDQEKQEEIKKISESEEKEEEK